MLLMKLINTQYATTYDMWSTCIEGLGQNIWKEAMLVTHKSGTKVTLKLTLKNISWKYGLDWTIGFHKMRGISWVVENRLASQETNSM